MLVWYGGKLINTVTLFIYLYSYQTHWKYKLLEVEEVSMEYINYAFVYLFKLLYTRMFRVQRLFILCIMGHTSTSFMLSVTLNLSVFPLWKYSTTLDMALLSCFLVKTVPPAVPDASLDTDEVGELAISICGTKHQEILYNDSTIPWSIITALNCLDATTGLWCFKSSLLCNSTYKK